MVERDIEAMVMKDVNHPSVILYSIGNEIPETGNPFGAEWGRRLAERVRSLDPTRLVTNGINGFVSTIDTFAAEFRQAATADGKDGGVNDLMASGRDLMNEANMSSRVTERTAESFGVLDVAGMNYADARYRLDRELFPNRIIVGSETFAPRRFGIGHAARHDRRSRVPAGRTDCGRLSGRARDRPDDAPFGERYDNADRVAGPRHARRRRRGPRLHPHRLRDPAGILVTSEDRHVAVTVEGAGVLQALGSARPDDAERYDAGEHSTFDGRALAVVRPTGAGTITVPDTTDGLEPVTPSLSAGQPPRHE
jgi:hypothetical protein